MRLKQKLISFDAREAFEIIEIPEAGEILDLLEEKGMNADVAAQLRVWGLPIAKILIPRLFEKLKLQGFIQRFFRHDLMILTIEETKNKMPEIGARVEISGGRYILGYDRGNEVDEKPEHTVEISPFAIDIFTVTNGQFREGAADLYRFREFWTAQGWQLKEEKEWIQPKLWEKEGTQGFDGDNQPVVGISWYEAFAYLIWRSKQDGIDPQDFLTDSFFDVGKIYDKENKEWIWKGWRLPTEAEIEIAIRGGQEGAKYPWNDVVGRAHYGQSFERATAEVNDSKFPPNGYGLRHSVGNVWIWGYDWYGEFYYAQLRAAQLGAAGVAKNPIGLENGNNRVVRGGCWLYTSLYLRPACRRFYEPVIREYYLGLRGAKSL
ncbi:MAG: SUMF1/EgtB/PvdO family nonheme iron enzyme [Candidatus Saganbacteria bacterium]|nr:SUMF1/EgtB/PvdO family nonheme iron enzyme [Candidatus Saganbacteria bacterium]